MKEDLEEDKNTQGQSNTQEQTETVPSESSEESQDEQPVVENTLEEELSEAKDKYLRLYSEFENFRRRTSKEKLDLISTANKNLMADLIPVIDDFERAMSAAESTEDYTALKEGMGLIQNKLTKTLISKGLEKMNIEKGAEFDDEKQEAITQIPAEEELAGKVVDVVEPGYMLGESVVRFAKVVVGAKQ